MGVLAALYSNTDTGFRDLETAADLAATDGSSFTQVGLTWTGVTGAAKYLDELLTWRQLAWSFCFHRPDHATVAALPAWGQTLAVLGAVATIVLAGRFLVRPAFRAIAGTRLRELFTAAALLLVIGIALLMTRVGLSPALGAFLAGVVLANSEYRHELESDIDPFKGLLLGLFFIAVGASIDFRLMAADPGRIAGLVVAGVVRPARSGVESQAG